MKAIILAAGRSTRTYPLTLNKPKPLLMLNNRPLLEHNLDQLEGIVDEAIIIVGYEASQITRHFGRSYKSIKLSYIRQRQQLGTGHALSMAKGVRGRFIVMMGDDLYLKRDIRKCLKHRYAILAKKVKHPQDFGIITRKGHLMESIIEKPSKPVSDLANCALYVLDSGIFDILKRLKKTSRNEYEITDALEELSAKKPVRVIEAGFWMPIGYPWDLLKADILLRKRKNLIARTAKITGKVINSSIGENCIIEGSVKNSIIMDNCIISPKSIIEDSILAEDVYFNGRAKSSKVAIMVNGKRLVINKLGSVIASNSIISKTLKPGTMLKPNTRN